MIRPGTRCCDIALELNEIFAGEDLHQYRTFGYGHSFGSLSHYYGREAGLELREDIETVLEPGMVVSMEPMIMIPEGKAGSGGYRDMTSFWSLKTAQRISPDFLLDRNTTCLLYTSPSQRDQRG